jgi:uncharacterized membrane protein YgaE (UPF0421/DUF939 family)
VKRRLLTALQTLAPVLVQAAKTAAAAGLAWFFAADLIGNNLPVFAPLAAVLTVQVTVWDSVSRGLQRALGVIVGVLLAYALARLLGIHVWSVALVVFVSWIAGQALRLGQQGAVQVPVSALLVLVLGASTTGYALDRVVDTSLGAAVGILVSLVSVPRTHLPEARADLKDLAMGTAGVLRDLASALMTPEADFAGSLARARQLDNQAKTVALVVQRTLTATRWSPTGYRDRPSAVRLLTAVQTFAYVERSTRGIARVLADATAGPRVAPELAASLAELLQSVADEVEEWADDVTKGEGTVHLTAASKVSDGYRDVLQAARSPGVDPETAAVADAIAVDGMRISVDLRTEPGPPSPAQSGWRSLLAP